MKLSLDNGYAELPIDTARQICTNPAQIAAVRIALPRCPDLVAASIG
ncbi:MAG: hypothetical protein KIT37_05175 [Steroidobacteraceae bacterium]|nr:hypothetical protein [Steroidobacteraceae bacterium]